MVTSITTPYALIFQCLGLLKNKHLYNPPNWQSFPELKTRFLLTLLLILGTALVLIDVNMFTNNREGLCRKWTLAE